MRNPVRIPVALFVVAGLLVIGSLGLTPAARADDPASGQVPAPFVRERHEYNVSNYDQGTLVNVDNEVWGLMISHGESDAPGEVKIAVAIRNITQFSDDATWVDYSFYVDYWIGGRLFVAQFMITETVFKIGNQTVRASLSTCDDFELTYSPVKYDGEIPTMDFNISCERIRTYDGGHSGSTFDLTLLHHYRGDWNQSTVKVEALLGFANTSFYEWNGTEFGAGEPFTAEVHYRMYMTEPNAPQDQRFKAPTGNTNTTLEYNITLDNGSPLTLSRMNMKDNFTIYNGSGALASVGYSSLVPGDVFSAVTHGFPGLTYKDTVSMKSDPEIVVNHDRVSDGSAGQDTGIYLGAAAVIVVIVAGVAGAVFSIRKRKKRPSE